LFDDQAKRRFNWQITLVIAWIVGFVTTIVFLLRIPNNDSRMDMRVPGLRHGRLISANKGIKYPAIPFCDVRLIK